MKTKSIIVIIVLITSFINCNAQHEKKQADFHELTDTYLGQKPPGGIPEVFASGIVSTDEFEFAITFSYDNKDIFFTRRPTNDGGGNSIMHCYFSNGKWSKPALASFAKANYIELAPYCAPDEPKVYFHSEREHPQTGKKMVNDEKIWFAVKKQNEWKEASFLSGILNTGWVMGIAPAKNATLYLCGEVDELGGVLRSVPEDGTHKNVEQILDGVHPYIAPDESFIIFDKIGQNWEETYLCISFKDNNGEWEEAIKLPEIINKTNTECFGRMSPDEKHFFFNREGDIYWVSSIIIMKLK